MESFEVEQLKALNLKPGDILFVKTAQTLTKAQKQRIVDEVKRFGIKNMVIVGCHVDIEILRKEQLKGRTVWTS